MFRFLIFIIPLFLFVGSLDGQVPTEADDIRGPKAQVEIRVQEQPPIVLWCSVGGGVLLLALAIVLWKKRTRKQSRNNPREVALANLAELELNRESLVAEAFANNVTQTVRQYISARFGIAAPRRTTEEFLRDLAQDSQTGLLGESDHLRTFLKSCDLAKFAGTELNSAQRGELVVAARNFVNSTSKTATP